MIPWKKIIIWLLPFGIFLLIIGSVSTLSPHPDQTASRTVRRSDATYAAYISSMYPNMNGTFSIDSVTTPEKNWVIVTLKNTAGDTLRTLLYDPLVGSQGIIVVTPPSKVYSPLDIARSPGVSIPQTVSEELTT